MVASASCTLPSLRRQRFALEYWTGGNDTRRRLLRYRGNMLLPRRLERVSELDCGRRRCGLLCTESERAVSRVDPDDGNRISRWASRPPASIAPLPLDS